MSESQTILDQIKKALDEAEENSIGPHVVLDYIVQILPKPQLPPSEPTYSAAIRDLRTWSEQQDSPGLLRGALSHLEASLEQRKKQ